MRKLLDVKGINKNGVPKEFKEYIRDKLNNLNNLSEAKYEALYREILRGANAYGPKSFRERKNKNKIIEYEFDAHKNKIYRTEYTRIGTITFNEKTEIDAIHFAKKAIEYGIW